MKFHSRKQTKAKPSSESLPVEPFAPRLTTCSDDTPVRKVVSRSHYRYIGLFPSLKNKGMLPWESGVEEDYFRLLETDNNVFSYKAQPHTLEYWWEGQAHRYTPDVEVLLYTSPFTRLVEVKPLAELRKKEVGRRFEWLKSTYEEMRLDFVVVTDDEIRRGPRLANAKLLLEHGLHRPEGMLRFRVHEVLSIEQPRTLGQLEAKIGGNVDHLRPSLFALALRGLFDIDLDAGPLSGESAVFPRRPI